MKDDTKNKNQDIEESMEELESINPDETTDGSSAKNSSDPEVQADEDVVFDDEAELGTAEIIRRLRSKLKTAVDEKQSYLNGWQRDKAEFINARKRDEEARQEFLKFAKIGVIEDLLPVLDSFDMAIGNVAAWETVSKEWRIGVEGIYNQLSGVLSKHGVKAYGKVGDSFDPNLHQSISMVKTDDKSADHTVAEVLQKGYEMNGKVIRPAMVRVFEV